MEKEGRTQNSQTENEEELLNFDLDDISTEDLEKMNLDSDEEIIELTDLVEKGPADDETMAMETDWSKESPPVEIEGDIELSTNEIARALEETPDQEDKAPAEDFDVSDISLELDLEDGGKAALEAEAEEGEITAAELDRILEETAVEPEIEMVEQPSEEKEEAPPPEISAAELESFFKESARGEAVLDLDEEPDVQEPEISKETQKALEDFVEAAREDEAAVALEPEEAPEETPESEVETQPFIDMEQAAAPVDAEADLGDVGAGEAEKEEEFQDIFADATAAELAGISEERVEAIITKVVEGVAERVIRETVAEVAEKVLTEAIDALKKSLDADSD